jgi:hypothetical protein
MTCIKDNDENFVLLDPEDDPIYSYPQGVPSDSIRAFEFFQEKSRCFKVAELVKSLVYGEPVFFRYLFEPLFSRMEE